MIAQLPSHIIHTDRDRMDSHWTYIMAVSEVDPQRALLLADQLTLAYKYDGVAAGDMLVYCDCELYGIPALTA